MFCLVLCANCVSINDINLFGFRGTLIMNKLNVIWVTLYFHSIRQLQVEMINVWSFCFIMINQLIYKLSLSLTQNCIILVSKELILNIFLWKMKDLIMVFPISYSELKMNFYPLHVPPGGQSESLRQHFVFTSHWLFGLQFWIQMLSLQ